MSRNKHIYTTEVTDFNGKKTHVISSKSLTDDSVHLNAKQNEFDASMTRNKKIIYTKRSTQSQTISGAWFLMNTLFSHGNIWRRSSTPADGVETHITCISRDVWQVIFGFTFGISEYVKLGELCHYAISINRRSFFPKIKMDLAQVIDTVIRADEDKMRHILNANPIYLLKKLDPGADPYALLRAFNSVGAPFSGTPFQAALACGDDDMAKMMVEHFARLKVDLKGITIDGIAEMQKQYKEFYTKSLMHYQTVLLPRVLAKLEALEFELLQNDHLDAAQTKTLTETQEKIKKISPAIIAYKATLKSSDIQKIIAAHTQAQIDNVFDVKPYFDAIESASPTEIDALHAIITASTQAELDAAILETGTSFTQTDACRNKPFNQLTLFEKMNHYREELRLHMQGEIIFNPNHILNALYIYYEKYSALDNAGTDTNHKKRDIIWCMGVGAAQRFASETYKQDIRQGVFNLIVGKKPRGRQSRFNDFRRTNQRATQNVLADVSLSNSSLIDGLGFKFACGGLHINQLNASMYSLMFSCPFSKLISSKNNNLRKLMRQPKFQCRLGCAVM